MKKYSTLFIAIIFLFIVLFVSCVKTLEEEGIYSTTDYIGTVVEKSTMQPIKGVKVQVTDGTHVHASTITNELGAFELKGINFEEVNKSYYLWLDGTSLDLPCAQEQLKGLGRKTFDYKTLILYDKTNASLLPKVTTEEVSDVAALTAKVAGNVTADGGHEVTQRGFCYALHQTPTMEDSVFACGAGTGRYTYTLSDLAPATTYFIRAFATNSIGAVYGAQKTFTTKDGKATITTTAATEVKHNSAIVGGNITDDGGDAITARGICWGTSENPTLENNHTTGGNGIGSFSHTLQDLQTSTTYYYRAYATNTCGTTYGTQKNFKTKSGLPELTTTSPTNITATSAKSGGNITDNGGFNVTARGVCWNTMGSPELGDQHTTNGSGNGSFTSNITGLTAGTTYYVRAYATNQHGTSYGSEHQFTASNGAITITLSTASNITATSATCSANITNDGGSAVTERGFCWSTSQYPTIAGSHTVVGSGTGSFSSAISSLSHSTTYYVRAYATNSVGTSYSNQISFSTNNGLPSVTTNTVSNITANSAVSGGNVTSDGGFPVTTKGICWSTSQYPTISNSHTSSGSGTGAFNASMSGLSANTTYYVRAYATNSIGTVYGTQRNFTTNSGLPTVSTVTATGSRDSVFSGGIVSDDGGYPITDRGICYSNYPNPNLTTAYAYTSDGPGTGYYTSLIDSIITGTVYVRAYATNVNGTSYGNQITVNMDYMRLPTFVHNGYLYRVAPEPIGTEVSWNSAISYCTSSTLYGYSDWRLPTLSELQTMCTNKLTIGGFSTGCDAVSPWGCTYWSSTTASNGHIYYVNFGICAYGLGTSPTAAFCKMRPIRLEN